MEETKKTAREIICRLIDEKAITGEEAITLIEELIKQKDTLTFPTSSEPSSPWKSPYYTPNTTTTATPKASDWITYTNKVNPDTTCCCQHNCHK